MLAGVATRVQVRKGQEVFAEGDPADTCYVLVRGSVRTLKVLADGHRRILEFAIPGELLGFECESEHTFTAEAVTDSTLLGYPRRAIERLWAEDAEFAREILNGTTRRLSSAYAHLALTSRKSARARLASFILDLSDRSANPDRRLLDLPMTRLDIADYLGMVFETVSRALGELKDSGAIRLPKTNRLEILDRRHLEELSQEN